MKGAIKKYSRSGTNRLIRLAAIIMISISAGLMLIAFICLVTIEDFSYRGLLLMRGGAGVAACLFAILYAILVYRVSTAMWRDKRTRNRADE